MDSRFRRVSLSNHPNLDLAYTAYGFSGISQHSSIVGFAGQWRDAVSGLYPLGNGRRMYSPSICRFTSPDGLSPFGRGGVNTYAYCSGDPVNYVDPSGHSRYVTGGQARHDRHRMDSRILSATKLPKSLRPQLEHFRQAARIRYDGNSAGVVVARLYKRQNPHYGYNRWDLKYSFGDDSFTTDFVFGDAIEFLPVGKYAISKNIFIMGVGGYQPARGLKNYQSYEVSAADMEDFHLPAARHHRPQLAESAWPEVANAMRVVRSQRENGHADKLLERDAPPEAPPSPPPRRR